MFRLTSALVLLVGLIASLTLAGAATADTTQKQLEMDAKIAQLDALIKQASERDGARTSKRGLVREAQRRGGGVNIGHPPPTGGGSNRSGND